MPRDVRFKNRPVSPSRPSTPRASRPDPDDDETDAPSVSAAPSAPVPWFKSPNVLVPIVLAVGLGGVGLWAWRETRGASPTAVAQSDGGATGDASEPATVADASAAPSQAPAPTPAPAPAAQGDGAALNGDPVEATHPRPTTPDPVHGEFPLSAAQQGIPGSGPLVADIETSMGRFSCTLLSAEAPLTVANFVGLARGTRPWWDPVAGDWVRRPYYDGSIFHRVIPGFMVQGGDVLRTGMGGPGYEFADENVQGHNAAGQLCMANHGANTNGGQFFITEAARGHLDGTYSIFGTCTPTDLVARITGVERDANDRPRVPVFIQRVTIRHAN